jgi:hypothetical protein
LRNIIVLAFILAGLTSCGYTPSSKFAREILGKKISTSVVISAQDPENTVIMKDAVDVAIIREFHASLVDRSQSDTHLILNMSQPVYTAIAYDKNGFATTYRMSITLDIKRTHAGISKMYKTKGTYDFNIAANAIISDSQRFDAIGFSVTKAIRAFIAKISAEGATLK